MSATLEDITYVLPPTLISRADVARLVLEVEYVDNELEAQKARAGEGEVHYNVPVLSHALDDFVSLNQIDLTSPEQRGELKQKLRTLKDKAPSLHFTFAVEADQAFLQDLAKWVREQIHKQALIATGLQPSLAGGTILRTPNHQHDFSLRELLVKNRESLVHQLDSLHAAG